MGPSLLAYLFPSATAHCEAAEPEAAEVLEVVEAVEAAEPAEEEIVETTEEEVVAEEVRCAALCWRRSLLTRLPAPRAGGC
jgi:hypothetical protein